MSKPKLVRITTVPLSLDKLLEGQLAFMTPHFEVIAVAADRPYLEKIAQREGVRSFMVPLTRKITPIKDLRAVYTLYQFLKKEKVTIVHSHTPKAGIVGMLAACMAGVKFRLHTVAGLPLMEATGVKRLILNTVERLTYRCATKVYPNAFGLKTFIQNEKFCSDTKLSVIGQGSSNGIDTNYFDPSLYSQEDKAALRNSLGISEDTFVFVFVGRLVTDKGINELVTAFHQMSEEQSKIALVLVGPLESELDPLKNETLAIINKHPGIYSVGYQKDVRAYYAFAKALVFPSYREGFPNVVLQAGAMGLPAIVTDINGCNEIITEGLNGKLVPSKNVRALQNAMTDMISNVDAYQDMQNAAREIIKASYKRNVIWNAILKEYQHHLGLS